MAAETWLLVLARDPRGAKSRLSGALEPARRAELAVAMLADVLAAAHEVPFARRLVATESHAMGEVAKAADVETLAVPLSTTNDAARSAFQAAAMGLARRALAIAADLPLLARADLEALLAEEAEVVIAPDRHDRGTNALLLGPPLVIAPAFGPRSFAAHRQRARKAGVRVKVVSRAGLATDVDDADDLRQVLGDPSLGRRTAEVLRPLFPGSP